MLLSPTLVDAAEILMGWWRMFGLCLVKVLARLVEIQSRYGLKTAKIGDFRQWDIWTWPHFRALVGVRSLRTRVGPLAGIRSLAAKSRAGRWG